MLRKELANLEFAVAAQNLSPEEVMRMTNERESLQRQLDEVRIKVAEAKQQSYDHEMLVTKWRMSSRKKATDWLRKSQNTG